METPALNSSAFWESSETHIALARGVEEPLGLRDFVRSTLGEAGWCLFQTSGTTGEQKWAVLKRSAFLISAKEMNVHCKLQAEDRWMIALPEHHVGGFAIHARAWLAGSAVDHFTGKWDAGRFCAECKASAVSLVPTQIHDLVSAGLRAPASLRLVLVGGGLLRNELAQRAIDLGWNVCATYAMTETASTVACAALDADRSSEPDVLEVLPHWEAQLDEAGTLRLRGPSLAGGYACPTATGWDWVPIEANQGLATRDRVSLWEHGTRTFMRFLGRADSFTKILGELVSLDALETHWQRVAAEAGFASRVALIAVPDDRQESRLIFCVDAAIPQEALPMILEVGNATVRPFERISEVLTVTDWPTTDLGKIKRAELVRLWTSRTQSQNL